MAITVPFLGLKWKGTNQLINLKRQKWLGGRQKISSFNQMTTNYFVVVGIMLRF